MIVDNIKPIILNMLYLANLFVEAAVVGVVCLIFMALMVVSGIRQILHDRDK